MKILELRIDANRFAPNTPSLICELLLFRTNRNLNRWNKRHDPKYSEPMSAAVCEYKKQPPDFIGTFLFSLDYLDTSIIVHEAVHMAKKYLRKIHRLHDEEMLCNISGYISNLTLEARPKLRRLYAKT